MLQLHWEVALDALPCYHKKCTRCGGELFENSGAFRVNANGKRLDVWLICRCTNCKTTWNLAVYERINRSALGETTMPRCWKTTLRSPCRFHSTGRSSCVTAP